MPHLHPETNALMSRLKQETAGDIPQETVLSLEIGSQNMSLLKATAA
jgi:hypothetical protein